MNHKSQNRLSLMDTLVMKICFVVAVFDKKYWKDPFKSLIIKMTGAWAKCSVVCHICEFVQLYAFRVSLVLTGTNFKLHELLTRLLVELYDTGRIMVQLYCVTRG
jgi:hypothetical protein